MKIESKEERLENKIPFLENRSADSGEQKSLLRFNLLDLRFMPRSSKSVEKKRGAEKCFVAQSTEQEELLFFQMGRGNQVSTWPRGLISRGGPNCVVFDCVLLVIQC